MLNDGVFGQNEPSGCTCPLSDSRHTFSIYHVLRSVAESSLTLGDPTDGSPPGSCVHGVLQERILEWVAISFSTIDHMYHLITCLTAEIT